MTKRDLEKGDEAKVGQRTSRKKRRARMPRPASNQSMTGSAYSCIEAVNTTRVYHPETYDGSALRERILGTTKYTLRRK